MARLRRADLVRIMGRIGAAISHLKLY